MEPVLWSYTDSLTVHEYITPYSTERTPDHVVLDNGRASPFYVALDWCPHCQRQAESVTTRDDADLTGGDDPCLNRYYLDRQYTCPTCGWWSSESSESTGSDSVDPWIEWRTRIYSILKAFKASDKDLPIETLRRTLETRKELLYAIHDKKFEELVASVMGDFYVGCEVKRCGRTGDGGIDLLVINCDTPIAVQVRRRMTSQKVETVYPVREFLGACLLKGHRELIYVTTARFSRGAANAANEAVKVELVRKYDLVDGEQFMSMLNLASTRRRRAS